MALPEADRMAMLALDELEADTCGGCGHALSETTRPGAMSDYDTKTLVCAGCASKSKVKNPPDGALLHVRKVWDSDTDQWLVPPDERPAR